MSFHDTLFPVEISYGSKGGPRFSTTVITLASGKERRNQNWVDVRAEYDVSHGIKDKEDMADLRDFFYARRGRAHSFRFLDPSDNELVNQTIGVGDGVKKSFQITKTYSALSNPYVRTITKPVDGSLTGVTMGVNVGIEVPWADTTYASIGNPTDRLRGFRINYNTGEIVFNTAPAMSANVVIGSISFHVHVRFDTDVFDAVHEFWQTESWSQILLVEIKDAV